MKFAFEKMHGLGNDFVVIDTRSESGNPAFSLNAQTISALGNRNTGIGFDQLLVIDDVDGNADIGYRIFNQNGNAVNQCGNGARCIAAFVAQTNGLRRDDTLNMLSPAGNVHARIGDDGVMSVDMGVPSFQPADLPLVGFERDRSYHIDIDGHAYRFSAVSVGNPHAVLQVDAANDAPVTQLGAALNAHAAFPQGVNVGFAEIQDRGAIMLRVFERGVGETRACGTGACAAMVTARDCGLVDERVAVTLPGGTLMIDWRDEGDVMTMTGPTAFSFSGNFAV